jgi:cysteine synthase A
MIYDSILDTIGNTPVVKLHRLAPKHVDIYVKVEAFNPAGSVKDRLALAIILDAEKRGALKPGQTVVEATSGNTGVALAAVCAARGYPFVAVMTETFSVERRKLIRAYGGKVLLTPAAERGTGMVRKAAALAKERGWFLANQFDNPANPATPPGRKSCATSPAVGWTISSAAGAPAARSPASARCSSWRGLT